MSNNYKIDWNFITKLEGGNHHQGYQPTKNSGVTIATGFDLKEKTPQSLKRMGFDDILIGKLEPYLGLTGSKAKGFASNLILDDVDTDKINYLSKIYYANDISKQYFKASQEKDFKQLEAPKQTVVASVGFQYGSLNRTPKFLGAVVEDRWKDVIKELRNFGDDFNTRRNIEADYLEERL